MAALLLETLGGGPEPLGPRFDVKARSREYLRRGLFLSGALHLALLFAFLHLPGSGDDVVLRSYSRATEIFREPQTAVLVPRPPASTPPAVTKVARGIFDPVDPRTIPVPPVDFTDFTGIGADNRSGPATKGAGPTGERETTPVPPPDPNQVYLVRDVDVPPVESFAPKPAYPEMAREIGLTGKVIAEVLVQPDGSVSRVRITSGNKILADSVQETLYRWRFHPGKVRGRPVAVWVEVPVNFTL